MGIMIAIGGGFLVSIIIGALLQFLSTINLPIGYASFALVFTIIALILLIARFVQSNIKAGRSYISLGIIASVILPLIIFGACIFTFSGGF